ncbi:hypothetical protein [Luteolibacter marinus]|uniref:hypothetical protein n=1 Tax=Luteolibacter marinus TaxID=2776705 RepID=UPI001868C6D7|nr:hypothetical protein [Luteolibacter marinus]
MSDLGAKLLLFAALGAWNASAADVVQLEWNFNGQSTTPDVGSGTVTQGLNPVAFEDKGGGDYALDVNRTDLASRNNQKNSGFRFVSSAPIVNWSQPFKVEFDVKNMRKAANTTWTVILSLDGREIANSGSIGSLYMNSDGWSGGGGGGATNAGIVPVNDTWYHVIYEWNGTSDSLTVDGNTSTFTPTTLPTGDLTTIFIGDKKHAGFQADISGNGWDQGDFQLDNLKVSTVGLADTDEDGMPDSWEEQYFPGDLDQLTATGDHDSDGLLDPDEFLAETDPTNPDTDGDDLQDGAEKNTYGSDPLLVDTDEDGLTDYQEVNGLDAEGNVTGFGPTSPIAGDSDDDLLSDLWELSNNLDPNDGTGDNGDFGDPDSDGLDNYGEQDAGTNPHLADTDGDDLDDGDEVHFHFTKPLLADSDGDSLGDGLEVLTTFTDPLAIDTDLDGFPDPSEVSAGTDGNDPMDFPSVDQPSIAINGNDAEVTAGGKYDGIDFSLFRSMDLKSFEEVHVFEGLVGSNTFVDGGILGDADRMFYQVRPKMVVTARWSFDSQTTDPDVGSGDFVHAGPADSFEDRGDGNYALRIAREFPEGGGMTNNAFIFTSAAPLLNWTKPFRVSFEMKNTRAVAQTEWAPMVTLGSGLEITNNGSTGYYVGDNGWPGDGVAGNVLPSVTAVPDKWQKVVFDWNVNGFTISIDGVAQTRNVTVPAVGNAYKIVVGDDIAGSFPSNSRWDTADFQIDNLVIESAP